MTQFWYFLINGKQDEQTGVYANFYSYGQHCGDALERTLAVAKTQDIYDCNAIETAQLDMIEEFKMPEDVLELDKGVFMRPTLNSFSIEPAEIQFVPPTGILKSTDDGEYDYDLIRENFVAYGKNENGIYEFQLVISKSKLIDTFIKTIDFLPTVDGFWFYIYNHWNDSKTELWVGKDIADKKSAVAFLLQHKSNTLENGYIDCVVHSKVGETNLTLDQHKKIQLFTKDQNLFNDFGKKIMDLGFKQTKEFYNLEFGYHHWHYRPANSSDRNEFTALLKKNNFELLDSWD